MNKNVVMGFAASALMMGALNVSAGSSDSEYPASYFEPKIVYIDKDAVKQSSKSTTKRKRKVVHDPKYPAAYFEPKVIYP